MRSDIANEALNRLWIIHNYSLPTYLSDAPPWWKDDDDAAVQVLRDIAREHRSLADRIGKMIDHYGSDVAQGKFPDRFTTMHDLSSQFMWSQMIEYQRRTVEAIERLIPQLPAGTIAQALAQECLGAAKGHLDTMSEIASTRAQLFT